MGGENEGSGLARLRYHSAAGVNDLARFVDSPLDAQIQAILRQPEEALQGSLTVHDFETLWVYARRCGVRAVRAADPELAASGLLALAFVDTKRFDFRDVLFAAGLLAYCLDRTGGDRVAAVEVAVGHASPATAHHLRRFDGSDPDALRLTTWGLAEVEVEEGPCFLGWGFRAYDVTVDLAKIALQVAGALEVESSPATSITIAKSLTTAWFPPSVRPRVKELAEAARGGAMVHAAGGLIGFIVETASEIDARQLASWASEPTSHHAALVLTDGQLLVLFVSRESTAEQLARLREPLAAVIIGLGTT
jgi:hypothetical protein